MEDTRLLAPQGDAAGKAAHAASLAKRSGKAWRLHAENEGLVASDQFSLLGELDDALREGNMTVVVPPRNG